MSRYVEIEYSDGTMRLARTGGKEELDRFLRAFSRFARPNERARAITHAEARKNYDLRMFGNPTYEHYYVMETDDVDNTWVLPMIYMIEDYRRMRYDWHKRREN